MKATVVEQDFAVAPQVTAADIADVAKEGVKTLINNRPDGEEPGQLSSADARAQAEKLGLQYIYLPVRTDTMTAAESTGMRKPEVYAISLRFRPLRTGPRS